MPWMKVLRKLLYLWDRGRQTVGRGAGTKFLYVLQRGGAKNVGLGQFIFKTFRCVLGASFVNITTPENVSGGGCAMQMSITEGYYT